MNQVDLFQKQKGGHCGLSTVSKGQDGMAHGEVREASRAWPFFKPLFFHV